MPGLSVSLGIKELATGKKSIPLLRCTQLFSSPRTGRNCEFKSVAERKKEKKKLKKCTRFHFCPHPKSPPATPSFLVSPRAPPMTSTVECGVRSVLPLMYHLPFLATHRPSMPVVVGPTASSWLTASRARRTCLLCYLGQLSPSTWCHVTGGPEMASGTAPRPVVLATPSQKVTAN